MKLLELIIAMNQVQQNTGRLQQGAQLTIQIIRQ
jgi:hypothetical protein